MLDIISAYKKAVDFCGRPKLLNFRESNDYYFFSLEDSDYSFDTTFTPYILFNRHTEECSIFGIGEDMPKFRVSTECTREFLKELNKEISQLR